MLRHAFSIGVIVLVATLAVLALHSGRTTEAAEPAPSPFARTEAEVLPGRLLVRFRDGTPPAERAAVHDVTAGRIERLLSSTGTEVVNVDAARLVTAFLAYRNSPHVEYVEPIGVMHATFDCTSGAGTITNDDCSSRQYGLHNDGGSYGVGSGVVDADIDAYDSWSSGYTGAGVTIAVLDTGYDTTHEDLAAKVSLAADFTGTGIEDLNGQRGHRRARTPGRRDAPAVDSRQLQSERLVRRRRGRVRVHDAAHGAGNELRVPDDPSRWGRYRAIELVRGCGRPERGGRGRPLPLHAGELLDGRRVRRR